jgi:hypothetical protein
VIWLLLAQLATWQPVLPPTLHQGWVQSCSTDEGEYILEHRVLGYLQWEMHLEGDVFALYAFRVAGDHDHQDRLNLLGTPEVDSLKTFRGARQWTVPSLHLWLSVVRAGDPGAGCDSFYIRIVRQ